MAYTYFRTPMFILRARELSTYDRMVYASICSFADTDGSCFPGYERIAERAGCSRAQAIKCIKKLERAGYIHVTRRSERTPAGKKTNSTNVYHIVGYEPAMRGEGPDIQSDPNRSRDKEGVREKPGGRHDRLGVVDGVDPKTTIEDNQTTMRAPGSKDPVHRSAYGPRRDVYLSKEEIHYLFDYIGEETTHYFILRLSRYMEQEGIIYQPAQHCETILRWAMRDKALSRPISLNDQHTEFTGLFTEFFRGNKVDAS